MKTADGDVPPQGLRADWKPSSDEDYGDGGAFPEIHIEQYPLGIGRTGDLVTTFSFVSLVQVALTPCIRSH